jgi:ParB-like chromosome segregation protein Spo0J
VLDHLSDRQRKAYIIADNQLALNAGWDTDLLRAELQDLAEQDFDLSLIGFSDSELNSLLSEVQQLEAEHQDGVEKLPPEKNYESATEYSEGSFQNFKHQCPRCGFEFGDA